MLIPSQFLVDKIKLLNYLNKTTKWIQEFSKSEKLFILFQNTFKFAADEFDVNMNLNN